MTYVISFVLFSVFALTATLAIRAEQQEDYRVMYINYFIATSMTVLMYFLF